MGKMIVNLKEKIIKDPKKWVIIGFIFVFILISGSVGAIKFSSSDVFCAFCHTYEKESWEANTHVEVNCITCHTKGFIPDKVAGMNKVVKTVTKQVDPWHDKLNIEFKDARCESCHFEPVTEKNEELIKRHDIYTKTGAKCMDCHGNVGHDIDILEQKYSAK